MDGLRTGVVSHVITGDRAEVHALLVRAWADGRLVSVARPAELGGDQVSVVAQLRDRSRWSRARPWLVGAVKAVAGLAVLAAAAGAGWLVVGAVVSLVALVTAVITWVQAHLVLLAVGAVVVVLLVAGAVDGRCGGMHCGGCRR